MKQITSKPNGSPVDTNLRVGEFDLKLDPFDYGMFNEIAAVRRCSVQDAALAFFKSGAWGDDLCNFTNEVLDEKRKKKDGFETILEVSYGEERRRLGFQQGKLTFIHNRIKPYNLTLQESVETFLALETWQGETLHSDAEHDVEARVKWLKMVASELKK